MELKGPWAGPLLGQCRRHLPARANPSHQAKLVRFVQNHTVCWFYKIRLVRSFFSNCRDNLLSKASCWRSWFGLLLVEPLVWFGPVLITISLCAYLFFISLVLSPVPILTHLAHVVVTLAGRNLITSLPPTELQL
jgi:hypothetical protein